jgi:hypothetical protein
MGTSGSLLQQIYPTLQGQKQSRIRLYREHMSFTLNIIRIAADQALLRGGLAPVQTGVKYVYGVTVPLKRQIMRRRHSASASGESGRPLYWQWEKSSMEQTHSRKPGEKPHLTYLLPSCKLLTEWKNIANFLRRISQTPPPGASCYSGDMESIAWFSAIFPIPRLSFLHKRSKLLL